MDGDEDTARLVNVKKKEFCTLGAAVNYAISLDFLAIFFCGVIIIGTLGTLQHDLYGNEFYHNTSSPNVSHVCILFSTCEIGPDNKTCVAPKPNGSRACQATMALFGLLGVLAVIFIVSLVVKALLRLDLNWTLLLEVPVLAFALVLEFVTSVMLSIGVAETCATVKDYNEGAGLLASSCNGTFPLANFTLTRAYSAMNTAWFEFLFFTIAMVVYIIRLVVYLRRKRKTKIKNTIEKENFVESTDPSAGDESLRPF